MPSKTQKELNHSSRLGFLGESYVQTVLLEWCDFVTSCGHTTPYDLILDHNNRLYKVQVKTVSQAKTKAGLRYRFNANSLQRSKPYYTSRNDIYDNMNDLSDKIIFYNKNDRNRKKIAKNGKKKYFKLFNEQKTTKYIVDKSLGNKTNLY